MIVLWQAKRAVSGAPTLFEVAQVKLDDKFQERVEGKKKFDKREDKKAAKSMLTIFTCGKWQPKNAVKVDETPYDDHEDSPDNLSPMMQFTSGSGKRRSTYRGRLNAAGQKEGHGVEEFADGTEYEGDYKNGVREGKGTVLFARGCSRIVKKKKSQLLKSQSVVQPVRSR